MIKLAVDNTKFFNENRLSDNFCKFVELGWCYKNTPIRFLEMDSRKYNKSICITLIKELDELVTEKTQLKLELMLYLEQLFVETLLGKHIYQEKKYIWKMSKDYKDMSKRLISIIRNRYLGS